MIEKIKKSLLNSNIYIKLRSKIIKNKENVIIKDIENDGIEIVYDPDTDESFKSKKKMKRWKKVILVIGTTIFSLVVLLAVIFVGLRISGKNSIYSKSETKKPDLSKVVNKDEDIEELIIDQDDLGNITIINKDSVNDSNSNSDSADSINKESGLNFEGVDDESGYDVIYNGVKYKYNKDVMTFLFLGIDKFETVTKAKDCISGGQSDALFLLVMNPHTMVMDIIAIHRNTIAEVWIYDEKDNSRGSGYTQICLQHAYGDGMKISNDRTMKAVSNMLYDLPIHGCTSINMGAIPELNDAIGGIKLNSLYTFESEGYKFVEGESVTLKGMSAYAYVHFRDIYRKNTAAERLNRQKQYINVYVKKAIEEVKKDIGKVVDVYDVIKKYVVTDFSLDEMTYLASEAVSYKFGGIYSLEGETIQKEGYKYERFYLDGKSVEKLIIDKFYEKAE